MLRQKTISIVLLLIFCASLSSTLVLGSNGLQNSDVIVELFELEEMNDYNEDSGEEERTSEDDYKLDCAYFMDAFWLSESETYASDHYSDIPTLLFVPPPER
jgi:hypothetical protein